jgi:hypothetical protein
MPLPRIGVFLIVCLPLGLTAWPATGLAPNTTHWPADGPEPGA